MAEGKRVVNGEGEGFVMMRFPGTAYADHMGLLQPFSLHTDLDDFVRRCWQLAKLNQTSGNPPLDYLSCRLDGATAAQPTRQLPAIVILMPLHGDACIDSLTCRHLATAGICIMHMRPLGEVAASFADDKCMRSGVVWYWMLSHTNRYCRDSLILCCQGPLRPCSMRRHNQHAAIRDLWVLFGRYWSLPVVPGILLILCASLQPSWLPSYPRAQSLRVMTDPQALLPRTATLKK